MALGVYIDRIFTSATGHDNSIYYYRIVRRATAYIWDNVAKVLADTPTWAASAIPLVERGTTGQFPLLIPAELPKGDTYEITVYKQAGSNPVETDDVSYSYEAKVGDIWGF